MSARFVRRSGILALATILIVPASALLVGSVTSAGFSNIERALAHVDLLLLVMQLAFVCCAAFVLWATQEVFNASGYRSANVLVGWLIIMLLFLPTLALLLWAWFSIRLIRFGRRVGSPLWQAIGVIYLIVAALLAGGIAIGFTDIHVSSLDAFMVILGPILLAGWLCHGVCLILSARKLPGSEAAVSR